MFHLFLLPIYSLSPSPYILVKGRKRKTYTHIKCLIDKSFCAFNKKYNLKHNTKNNSTKINIQNCKCKQIEYVSCFTLKPITLSFLNLIQCGHNHSINIITRYFILFICWYFNFNCPVLRNGII